MDNDCKVVILMPQAMHYRIHVASIKAGYSDIDGFIMFILQNIFPEKVEKEDLNEKDLIEAKLRDLGYI